MNKSFKDRLAALEALEQQAEAQAALLDGSALTWEDREALWNAISTYAATLDAGGLLVRSRPGTAPDELDQALSRCNAGLLALRPRLTTIEDVDQWVRDLPDLETMPDDELVYWVFYGLAKKPPEHGEPLIGEQIRFTNGELRVTVTFPGALPRWWGGIVERAAPLLKEQGIVFFPLSPPDVRRALGLLDAGAITCKPLSPNCWKSHNTTIHLPYNSDIAKESRGTYARLVHALDQWQAQTGDPFIETAEGLRAVLESAIANMPAEEDAP